MHKNELPITTELAYKLIQTQFPQYAHLAITPILSSGTDNALYRLGDHLCIRLPRIGWVTHYHKNDAFLSLIAPQLPVAIPMIVEHGKPTDYYPYDWAIYTWIEGENAYNNHTFDEHQAARDLAQFIKTLHSIPTITVPPSTRGVPLITRNQEVHSALKLLHNDIDTHAAQKLWKSCINAPDWHKKPAFIHGDLLPTNIVVHNNHISGIIDFDLSGTGDPSIDLLPAWSMLSPDARETFRATVGVDDATWLRSQGWALSIALIIIPYYKETNPVLTAIAYRMINELLK